MPVVSRIGRARWRGVFFAMLLSPALAFAQDKPIDGAVLPLPTQLRADAAVVRLNGAMKPVVLRAGTNGMVCIADTPGDDEFDVRCYRETFIPVVYRGFQLRSGEKVGAEIQAGKLTLSKEPTAGYRCLGPAAGYDATHNAIDATIECWQSTHFPYRTAAEVGFPDEADVPENQQQGTPYVMSSGTYWSHVMIRHPMAAPARPDARSDVAAALATWNASASRGDVDAFMQLFDPSGQVLLAGSDHGEVFRGTTAIRAWLGELFEHHRFSWDLSHADIDANGDTAWVFVDGVMSVTDDAGAITKTPYRFSGVMVERDHAWKWRMFDGSIPAGE